jgi:hypothetical protein
MCSWKTNGSRSRRNDLECAWALLPHHKPCRVGTAHLRPMVGSAPLLE